MKVIGTLMPARLGLLAAGAAVVAAASACTPQAPGSATPAATAPAPSSAVATATASAAAAASPSASPGTSATVGALVAGFPSKLLPVMPGTKVVASSFDKSASPATAALVGSTAAKPAAVVAYYTKALEAQGFKAVPGSTVGSVASKDFVRAGNETVNIAVPATGGVSTFTIGANVTPESVK
ncbi:hypothetical protein QFZ23_001791 [Arthrobacter globiformis]|uniref:hypothetical protein n=1 Tax=Arthrobacter globiformis TaxID=1665 RepID=UPI0027846409|nr:hypothetical protein [Arthrobacter globiformis]MDQ1057890.1 hypothetical protein [Arthrobacter globiformis]